MVGVVALAVLLIIVLIIVGGSGEPADQPTPSPTTTESGEPGAPGASGGDAAEGEIAACTASQVTVTAVTDSTSYPAGQQPLLSLTLLNTSTTACTIQAGSDVQSYVITSGSDRIWASNDCLQAPGVAAEATLEPGEPLSAAPFAWSRTRSSADDCAATRDPVIAGGATYRLSVSVGEFASTDDRPFILN